LIFSLRNDAGRPFLEDNYYGKIICILL